MKYFIESHKKCVQIHCKSSQENLLSPWLFSYMNFLHISIEYECSWLHKKLFKIVAHLHFPLTNSDISLCVFFIIN